MFVDDGVRPGDNAIVCLQEQDTGGNNWSLADVSIGAEVGTFYGTDKSCPASITPANLAALGSSW